MSSEDKDIARVAERSEASINQRPSTLADDYTPTIPVVRHAISILKGNESSLDAACCIYPMSQLIKPEEFVASDRLLR